MYFYNINSTDEINQETKIITAEIKQGIADPVRTAAIIEMQNFMDKNLNADPTMIARQDDDIEDSPDKTGYFWLS